jgi:predicted SAM-dependent methyltransferase
MLKLNLGCGKKLADGYVNIDMCNREGVVVADIRNLTDYQIGTVDEIILCDVIEHFEFEEACGLLRYWCGLLKSGGTIVLSTFDFEVIANKMLPEAKKEGTFGAYLHLSRVVFAYDREFDRHKSVWFPDIMYKQLDSIGMINIKYKPRGKWCMQFTADKP